MIENTQHFLARLEAVGIVNFLTFDGRVLFCAYERDSVRTERGWTIKPGCSVMQFGEAECHVLATLLDLIDQLRLQQKSGAHDIYEYQGADQRLSTVPSASAQPSRSWRRASEQGGAEGQEGGSD
jgi:hypothetical protein